MWKSLKHQVSAYPKAAAVHLGKSLGVVLYFSYFFYKSWWAVPGLLPIGAAYFINQGKYFEEKRQREFERQFQECILSVAAGLRAGYSMENAFVESVPEMKMLFGEKSRIVGMLGYLIRGMQNNIPLEVLLSSVGRESGSNLIGEFAEIFHISVRSGGNLTEMIVGVVDNMNERLRMEQEIQDVISGRRFEQKVMNVIPFLLTAYIQSTNKGYFDSLYYNLPGIFFMTVCLGLYLASYVMAEKISRIQ